MRVLLVGGGSGGHITPLLAIAKQLRRQNQAVEIHVVSERLGKFKDLVRGADNIDGHHWIFAGKLRRYSGESWLKRLTDIKTILLNLRDLILLVIGCLESAVILLVLRPDVVFIKGGFVGVPVGLASRLLRIPYITHDSDITPGLTNRLIGPGAQFNAVGTPTKNYNYPKDKIIYTGVPITDEYETASKQQITKLRSKLGIKSSELVLLVLGGSLGAQKLDKIMRAVLPDLLREHDNLRVIHQVSQDYEDLYDDYPAKLSARIATQRYLKSLAPYVILADLIVSRAGATTITELAAAAKPVILVPAPQLSSGHQVANARELSKQKACLIVNESEALEDKAIMTRALKEVLSSKKRQKELANNLTKIIPTNAAQEIAKLLTKVGQQGK